MITMAIQAAYEILDSTRVLRGIEARKILFKRPLLIPSGDIAVETAIHLRPNGDGGEDFSFRIFSQAEGEEWEENCSGLVSLHYLGSAEATDECDWTSHASLYSVIRQRATRKLSPRTFYKFFDKKMNLQYGPLHQNVSECIAGVREGHGTVTIPDTKSSMPSQFEYPHLIHPATLDSIFHLQALGYLHTLSGDESLVPISIESVFLAADIPSTPGTLLSGYSNSVKKETGDFIGDIVLSDNDWSSPKAIVRGFLSRDLAAANPKNAMTTRQRQKCTTLQWEDLNQAPPTGESTKDSDLKQKDAIEPNDQTIRILCRKDASPGTLLLVENLTRILEELHYEVLVTSTLCLVDEKISEPSRCIQEVEITQPLLPKPQLEFESATAIISLLEIDRAFVAEWTEAELNWFRSLANHTTKMLWVTRGGDYSSEENLCYGITTGLLRTLRVEMPQLRLPHLDLPLQSDLTTDINTESILMVLETIVLSKATIYEQEFAVRGDKILVPRLRLQESFHRELSTHFTPAEPFLVHIADLGSPIEGIIDPNTNILSWRYAKIEDVLGDCELEILPSAVTLDATSIKNRDALGVDAIGTILKVGSAVKSFVPGETVLICASHTLRTSVCVDQSFVRHIPQFIDPGLLVTLPSALCTAQGALLDLGRLQKGEILLIAARPGRVEQALLHLARQIGAEVFLLAQDANHEQTLVEGLGIDEDHVFTSSTLQDSSILGKTDGIDLFVTTLTTENLVDSMKLLSDFARFVTIGTGVSDFTAASFPKNITVSNFDLEHMRRTSPSRVAGLLKKAWDRASKHGLPQAMCTRSYHLPKVEAALGFLKSDRCFGSAVLKLAPEDQVLVPPPSPAQLKLDPLATYVLAGGLGGIGRSIADMMFDQAGARNIIFLSRSGAASEDAQHFIDSLLIRGCNAQASQCDISDPDQIQIFVTQCESQGMKIKGVIQCAMVLRDSMFENMTFQQ